MTTNSRARELLAARLETVGWSIARLTEEIGSVATEATIIAIESALQSQDELIAKCEAIVEHELTNCMRRQRERPEDSKRHATAGASVVCILHEIRALRKAREGQE
jgi:hypothetical protein